MLTDFNGVIMSLEDRNSFDTKRFNQTDISIASIMVRS